MNIKNQRKSLIQSTKENIEFPKKEKIINDLKELKKAIQYVEEIINDENYKPLSKKSIDELTSFPQAKCINEAYIHSIVEKLKTLIEKNKSIFENDFKTEIENYYISIYCQAEERLTAIKFDISEYPPTLESIIYNTDSLTLEKKNLMAQIDKLQKEIDIEIEKSKNAQIEYETMKNNPESLIRKKYISELKKQEEKMKSIWHNICEKSNIIENKKQRLEELENKEKKLSNINLDDFIKLRNQLYEELGFILENESVSSIAMIYLQKELIKNNVYTIGKNEYRIKYKEKTLDIK